MFILKLTNVLHGKIFLGSAHVRGVTKNDANI